MSHARTPRPWPRPWRHRPALALLAGLVPATLSAAVLGGLVTDDQGRPLEGVLIQSSDQRLGASSDAAGRFRLVVADERLAGLRLRFSHLGYAKTELAVAGGSPLTIRMTPSLLDGVPVTVTASRVGEDGAATHTNLGRQELQLTHHGQDLSRLLDGTPSLSTFSYSGTSMGYNEIRLRGFDQKRVEVLVNGVPVNDPEDHYVYWVDLPDLGRSLRDVQIQRGTGSGHFGGSNLGGSVNLLTGADEEPGLRLESGMGSFGTRRQSLSWSSGVVDGRWQMDARWSQMETDGYRDASGSEMWGAYFSGRRFWQGGSLRLTHYTGHELTHTAWDGVTLATLRGLDGAQRDRTQNNDAAYANSIDDFRQPHSEAELQLDLPDGSRLEATLFHVDGAGFYETWKTGRDPFDYGLPEPEDGSSVDLVNRRWIDKRQTGLTVYNRRAWAGGDLTLGISGYGYSAQHWGQVVWASPLPGGRLPGGRYYTHDTVKEKGGLLASWERDLGGDLRGTATLALQHTRYTLRQRPGGSFQGALLNRFEDDHDFLNPALGLRWSPAESWSLFASLSATGREPSRSEYWNAWEGPDDLGKTPMFQHADTLADGSVEWSGPLVDPERMLDAELGGEWRGRRHLLRANLYWMEMRDEIVAYGGVDEESPVRGNAPRSHHAGIELDGRLRLASSWETGGNVTLSQNRIDELVLHETRYAADWSSQVVRRDMSGNPAALSPALLANLWVEWRPLPGLTLRPRLQHVGKQYLDTSGDDGFSALDPALVDPDFLAPDGTPRHSKTLDPYTVLGLDARYSLPTWHGQQISLSLQVENLLDSEYETGGYWNDWVDRDGDWLYEPQPELYPAAGRNWMLGLAWKL